MGTRTPSDQRLQEVVQAAVKGVAGPAGKDIRVSVSQGRVVLTGRVRSLARRWAVAAAARRASGTDGGFNDIDVPALDPAHPPDADLTMAAICALTRDPQVPIAQLQVSVQDGWLTLVGEVERPLHKLAAERVARDLPSIRGFTNLISVRARQPAASG